MSGYSKPLPQITERTRPFWDGLREGRLLIQQCDACGHLRFPPGLICPACRKEGHTWVPSSGKGKIWSFTVFHKLYLPGFEGEMPYNVAIVELVEGLKLYTNIAGLPNAELRMGMPVEAVFEPVTSEVTLVKFQPRATSGIPC